MMTNKISTKIVIASQGFSLCNIFYKGCTSTDTDTGTDTHIRADIVLKYLY